MGNQRVTSPQGMEGDRESSDNSASQHPESPVAKLQEILGNRAGSDRFKADLHHYQQARDKDTSHPLDALLASMDAVKSSRNKPIFRGLSHELQANATPSGMLIQAKMTVRPPGDRYEQEADQVAEQVVEQINSSTELPSNQPDAVKSLHAEAPQPKAIQPKSISSGVSAEGGIAVTSDLESLISRARNGGQPLPDTVCEPMEQAMGADFSGVRVHADRRSNQLNRAIQAEAFTTGQDIFFQQGAYTPQSQQGQALIAHELTHVVQQNGTSNPHSLGSGHGGNSRTIQMQNTISGEVRVPNNIQAMIYQQLPIQSLIALSATSKNQRQAIETFLHEEIYDFVQKNNITLGADPFRDFLEALKSGQLGNGDASISEAIANFFDFESLEKIPLSVNDTKKKKKKKRKKKIKEAEEAKEEKINDPKIYAAIGIFKASGILRVGPDKTFREKEEGQYKEGEICRILETRPTKRGKNPNYKRGASGEKGNLITDLVQEDWMIVSITTKKGRKVKGCVPKSNVDFHWAEYKDINPEIPILFKKPEAGDVKQGLIGDCFFQAALIAIVETKPGKIEELFSNPKNLTIPIGKDKITIQFYRRQDNYSNPPNFVRESVTINPTLPSLNRQITTTKRVWQEGERVYAQGPAIWPALIEKAYAKWKGEYAQIDGGSVGECLTELLGQEYQQVPVDLDAGEELPKGKKSDRYSEQLRQTYNAIVFALSKGEIVCLGTHEQWEENQKEDKEGHSAGESMRKGMAAKHAYAVVGVYKGKKGKLYLRVRNPWGKYGTIKKTILGISKRVIEEGEKGAISDIELSMLPLFFSVIYMIGERATELEQARRDL